MISTSTAIELFAVGQVSALLLIAAGTVLHMRWLDKKLLPSQPKPTQKLPVVKPTNGATI